MNRILICDDEADIRSALRIYLNGDGYEVTEASNGQEALDILAAEEIHLVLLDVMMPVMDGIQTMSEIRKHWNLPVILLTAKSEETDIILGLNLGADDYITKPFRPVELMARVKASLRRYRTLGGETNAEITDRISFAGMELDDDSKRAFHDGEELSLTPTEYDILKVMMSNPGKVLSPKEIYQKVWRADPLGQEGVVAVHVRHLREKIEYDPSSPRHLIAVWGRGYVLQ